MKPMRGLSQIAGGAGLLWALTAYAAPAPSPWEQPAATLSEQVAGILGPGQARLTIRNLSSISVDEIPAIRKLLEKDLKEHGVVPSGTESANAIRITLSENARERLWVAEVIEGNETRVAMAHVELEVTAGSPIQEKLVLHKESYPIQHGLSRPLFDAQRDPVLAVVESHGKLMVLRQDEIMILGFGEGGWRELAQLEIPQRSSASRDPRGMLLPTADGNGFTAYTAGSECTGNFTDSTESTADGWTVQCHASDDPWPILTADAPTGPVAIKAFYHSARNFFTGVVTPSVGVDLPPFYSAALLPRPAGAMLLIEGIDGKVQLAESGALKPVSGTRDWGSDFAALHSGCGGGEQIVASSSGEAVNDSLRAYEIPAQEAISASAPVAMDGTVTALWTAPDGKSLFAVVRKAVSQGSTDEYEVDRVTASCNE
jgi:hypothetical protein